MRRIDVHVDFLSHPRGSETSAKTANTLSRFSVSSNEPYGRVCDELAQILLDIEPRQAQMVLEFEELWTRKNRWIGIEGKHVVDLERTGQTSSIVQFNDANKDVVYQELDGYCCSLLCARDKLVDYLRIMNAAELYVTYWRHATPAALLPAAGKALLGDSSRYFLENIGPYDPVVFLSRSNVDMAIVVKDAVLKENIKEYLEKYELEGCT